MRKLLKLTFAILASLCLMTSCSEKEANHNYQTYYQAQMKSDDSGKVRYEMIKAYVDAIDGGYFTKMHSYFGLEVDADRSAWNDFRTSCEKIDTAAVSAMLESGEQFHIILSEIVEDAQRMIGAMSWSKPDTTVAK